MSRTRMASAAPAGLVPPAAPAPTRCRNCDAALVGPFCSQCGQRDVPLDPTAREMLRDMVEEATDVDGRLATTLRALFVPGRLTRDWAAGRRARYFSPLKLYLTISVLYFLASAVSPTQQRAVRTTEGGGASTTTITTPAGRERRGELPGFLDAGLQRVARDPDAFQRRVTEWAPRIFFLLVPLFAAFTALVYRGRRRRMPHHVWIALHLHAAGFLLGAIGELSEFTRSLPLQTAVGVLVMGVFPVYVALTLRAVYGGTWAGTIARVALLGALYVLGAVVTSALALAVLLAFA